MSVIAPSRHAQTVALVHVGAMVYAVTAFVFAAFMTFILFSSAFSPGGGPAITLPVEASAATEVSSLSSDPETPDAHFTEVEFTAEGLSPGASLLYFAPRALTPIAHGIVALGIMMLARNVKAGHPFAGPVVRAFTLSGLTIAGIGSANQLLTGFGTSMARWELLGGTPLGGWVASAPFDWTPVLIGITLGIIAGVFEVGRGFQRDAAGLVPALR
jgi:hypothetical protein